jgi:hypothetical protein
VVNCFATIEDQSDKISPVPVVTAIIASDISSFVYTGSVNHVIVYVFQSITSISTSEPAHGVSAAAAVIAAHIVRKASSGVLPSLLSLPCLPTYNIRILSISSDAGMSLRSAIVPVLSGRSCV